MRSNLRGFATTGNALRAHGDWLLTPYRVAVHEPTVTAVVADVHLGYAEARRRRGDAVPTVPLDIAFAELLRAVREYGAQRLVVAGDLFESGRAGGAEAVADWCDRVGVEWTAVVPGNHDRGLVASDHVPLRPEGVRLGEWLVVHGDGEEPEGPAVCGHWHPCLVWESVRAPCFLVGERRLILPAYSREAAGGNVAGQAEWREMRVAAAVDGRVLDFGPVSGLRFTPGARRR